MCGFVGYVNKNMDQIDSNMIKSMMKLQEHRGPDDSGLTLFSSNGKNSLSYNQNELKNFHSKDNKFSFI